MLRKFKRLNHKILKLRKIKFVNKSFFSSKRFLEVMRSVYGINYYMAKHVVVMLGFSENIKFEKISEINKNFIADFFLSYFFVERGLTKYRQNILTLRREIGSEIGYRLFSGLPVNGQRTHTNARTVRKMFKGSMALLGMKKI